MIDCVIKSHVKITNNDSNDCDNDEKKVLFKFVIWNKPQNRKNTHRNFMKSCVPRKLWRKKLIEICLCFKLLFYTEKRSRISN